MTAKARLGWLTIILLILPILVCAQNRPNKGMVNWSSDTPYVRMYNPQTVQTVTVTVQKVEIFSPEKGMSMGIHLTTNLNDELLDVHLGPAWFIKNQELQIIEGDELEITGSMITFEGSEALIAKTVKLKEDTLTLRDDTGRPVWAGWTRGRRMMN